MRARMNRPQLWDGLRTTQIAQELGCHPQTVRERIHRFDERRDSTGLVIVRAPAASRG